MSDSLPRGMAKDTERFEIKACLLTIAAIIGVPAIAQIALPLHESGHAIACFALGGNVGGFSHWLYTTYALHATDCSIKPYPSIVWAGGNAASVIAWLITACIALWLLNGHNLKPGPTPAYIWAVWSFWSLITIAAESYHAYSPPSVWEDSTQFVHTTTINPNLVGLPLATIFIVCLWLWWRIQYRLLPQAAFFRWQQVSTYVYRNRK